MTMEIDTDTTSEEYEGHLDGLRAVHDQIKYPYGVVSSNLEFPSIIIPAHGWPDNVREIQHYTFEGACRTARWLIETTNGTMSGVVPLPGHAIELDKVGEYRQHEGVGT